MDTEASGSKRLTRLLNEGLRQLRRGKVSAALQSWDDVLELDVENETAASFRDYVRQNRIRIAVHLGRSPPNDDEPIDLPKNWPAPPTGLCAPIPAEVEEVATPADSSGDEPYAEVEIIGLSSAEPAAVNATRTTS